MWVVEGSIVFFIKVQAAKKQNETGEFLIYWENKENDWCMEWAYVRFTW